MACRGQAAQAGRDPSLRQSVEILFGLGTGLANATRGASKRR